MTDPRSPTALATPSPGAVLGGRFTVVRTIGEGGMGVVVEAENTLTGKRVAIKWMHPAVAAHPEAAKRFIREAQASARLRHPNVIDVYDVIRDGDALFMVMELLEGEPLSAVLARGGLPAHEMIGLLIDAMRGVAAAHRQGVIHRDIKPDNIFLARHADRAAPVPKVLDFGISKVSEADGLALTRTGTTMGTPMYMSFEQLINAKDIDPRTDVYAFAVILYEALTGQAPYDAETFAELVVKISSTTPRAPKLVQPSIPEGLDRVVVAAMAKERNERTASLEALIAGLQPFAAPEAYAPARTAAAGVAPARSADDLALPASRIDPERQSTPMATSVVPPEAIPVNFRLRPWLVAAASVIAVGGAALLWQSEAEPTRGRAVSPVPAPIRPERASSASAHKPGTSPAEKPDASVASSAASLRPALDHTGVKAGASLKTAPRVQATASDKRTLAAPVPHERPDRQRPRETPSAAAAPSRPVAAPPPSRPAKPSTQPSPVLRAGQVHADDF